MEITVIHTEAIKPSTPTPSHKKHLQLSFLDQILPGHFLPYVYFYPCNYKVVGEGDGIRTRLKKSLADTLTWYYPLAGRVKDRTIVECNDEGVPYFETQVTGNLNEVAEQRKYAVVNSMCPFSDTIEDAGDVALAVQVNFFSCGGIAIGVCLHKLLGDGWSMITFLKFWSAVARGDHNRMVTPQFGLANVFPPRGSIESQKGIGNSKDKKLVGKSFLFTKSSISALKTKYGARTSVEALTTFIVTRFISIASQKRKFICCLPMVAANLRTRLNPPLSDSHFGNVSRAAGAYVFLKDGTSMSIQEETGYDSLTKIRDVIKHAAGGEAIKRLQEGNMELTMVSDENDTMMLKKFKAKGVMQPIPLVFSSLSRFPMYDIDFGWGRPVWATFGILSSVNMFVFMPTPSGNGIEVLFTTSESDLNSFETDKEFLTFATPAGNSDLSIPSSL